MLTLLHTPVKLSQNVIKQDVTEGLEVLGEDITDGIKCMVAGGGHPLCFLRAQHNLCQIFFFLYQHENKDCNTSWYLSRSLTKPVTLVTDERLAVYLGLLLRKLHVVKNPEDNSEQVLPPVFLKGVPIGLHHFKHHRQPPGECAHTKPHLSFPLCDSWHLLFCVVNGRMCSTTVQNVHVSSLLVLPLQFKYKAVGVKNSRF